MKPTDQNGEETSRQDSPDKDEYHDDNRRNDYDEQVAEDIGADEEE